MLGERKSALGAVGHDGVAISLGAFLLLVGYATIEFVRPQALLGLAGPFLRFGLLFSVLLFVFWVRKWGPRAAWSDQLLIYFCAFTLFSLLWVPFVTNNFVALHKTRALILLLVSATVPISLILVAPKWRIRFFSFWLFVHLYLSVYALTHEGRGPGGVVADENDMALTILMGLPFAYFLSQSREVTGVRRLCCYAVMLVMLAAIVSTHSRGGFVALVAVTLYILYLSRNRIRNLVVLGILGLMVLQFAPESYVERVNSISDTEDTSRVGRLTLWRVGWSMFLDHPVIGVGPGNFPSYAGVYHRALPDFDPAAKVLAGRAAHSLYFTLIPEYGLVGIILFYLIVTRMMRRLRGCEKMLGPHVDDGNIEAETNLLVAKAIRASLIVYLTAGTFLSVLYYPNLWYTMGFVIALSRDVERRYGSPPAKEALAGSGPAAGDSSVQSV